MWPLNARQYFCTSRTWTQIRPRASFVSLSGLRLSRHPLAPCSLPQRNSPFQTPSLLPDAEDELPDTEFSQSGGDTIFSFTRYTSPDDSSKMNIPDSPGSHIYIMCDQHVGLQRPSCCLAFIGCDDSSGVFRDK